MPPPDSKIARQAAAQLAIAAGLLQRGQSDAAIAPLRKAARLLPGNATILHDLGLACLESGKLGEAIAALQRAVKLQPHYADAHLRLGIGLEMSGALEAALGAYRRAANGPPPLPDAHYRAGELLDSVGRTEESVAHFRAAADAARETTLGRMALARLLLAENRHEEAEDILARALSSDRDNAAVLELLGNLQAERGRFGQAGESLLRAVAQAPLRAGAYYDIVRCRRIGPDDADLVARMQQALGTPGLDPIQRARVHLALGKAAEDLGQYERAMRHFDAADRLRAGVLSFDLPALEARIERLIAAFSGAAPRTDVTQNSAGPKPILILGLPRSGTTLIERILSAHADVHAGGELPFWNDRGGLWDRTHAHANAEIPPALFAAQAAADYSAELRTIAPLAAFVTDKMPLNFQWAGLIHLAFPDATIIHCQRAPIGTALSIHQTHFNPRMAFPTGGAALVGYIRAYQRLCAHWRRVLPPSRFIEIRYEALVDDPEIAIRRIVRACGLKWDESCLSPETASGAIRTASKWQARQPITRNAAERWRSYERWLGELGALRDENPSARDTMSTEY